MRRNEETRSTGGCIAASLFGGGVGLISIVIVGLLFAAAILSGAIPEKTIPMGGFALTVLAALIGGTAASKAAGCKRLPTAFGAAAVYFLLVLLARKLFFADVDGGLLRMILAAGIGALLAGVLSAGKKRRRS